MRKLTVLLTWLGTIVVTLSASLYFAHQVGQARILNHFINADDKVVSMAPATALSFAALPKSGDQLTASIGKEESRTLVVQQFLARYSSPLADYAQYIVETSDVYGLPDFRIIPAIAMQESNGCKKLPEIGGAYNCWGYGVYGKSAVGFTGYEEAIDRVARGLKQDYYNKGLTTPYQIMTKYTPPSLAKGGPWAKGVEYFLSEMR